MRKLIQWTARACCAAPLALALFSLRSPAGAEAIRPKTGKLLAVYNTGANYRLIPAAFGGGDTLRELHEELALAHDTAVLFVHKNRASESGIPSGGVISVHSRFKMSRNVAGKIAIMPLCNYDPTMAVLNAQRLGAKGFIFIHSSDRLDSIRLTGGIYADSIHIPVYALRRETGALVSMMLPSQAGVKTSGEKADDDQPLQAINPAPLKAGTADTLWAWMRLSPNPANQSSRLSYDFPETTDLTVEARNAAGQLVWRQKLAGVQSGEAVLNTSEWVSGVYFVGVLKNNAWTYRKLEVAR